MYKKFLQTFLIIFLGLNVLGSGISNAMLPLDPDERRINAAVQQSFSTFRTHKTDYEARQGGIVYIRPTFYGPRAVPMKWDNHHSIFTDYNHCKDIIRSVSRNAYGDPWLAESFRRSGGYLKWFPL